MVKICLAYFPWQTDQNFLLLKQDIVDTQPWQFAFKVHVIASSFVLIAGFTQFFRIFRNKHPRLHRLSGWLYILTILIFALPSGFILAVSASGGISTQISFILLCFFWGISTVLALYYALKKQWLLHRDWVIRSFALSLSALSLRTWKMVLYPLQPYFEWLTPVHIYQLESWLGWVINLLIAEIIIIKLHQKKFNKST
ncbi:DUF2306 domain-containing protein [Acinetobacter sp. ULE_I010]|uniref:DUF2306 domain-containing protein n=1 Tax=Acinetobacter sp. ULE_I010 TaxID=3373065 RepID=UPI003AF8FF70